MNKYFTKRDIMQLICVTSAQFEWCVKNIGLVPYIDNQRLYFYTIQHMIEIYNFIYRRKKCMVLQSKSNSYE